MMSQIDLQDVLSWTHNLVKDKVVLIIY